MPSEVFVNVGVTKVAGTLPATGTTLNVTPGTGLVLPAPVAGDYFTLLLTSTATGNMELVRCTARNVDTLTIERAQEPIWGRPATAFDFSDGDQVLNAPSAAFYMALSTDADRIADVTRIDAALATETAERQSADTTLQANIDLKADATALTTATSAINVATTAQLALKADLTYVDTELGNVNTQAATATTERATNATRLETLRVAVNANTLARMNYNPPHELPAGTRMLFHQATPPPGWTKDSAHNDHALRITSGTITSRTHSAGPFSTGRFTNVFRANVNTETVTLTTNHIPTHKHEVGTLSVSNEGHRHLGNNTQSRNTIPQGFPDPVYEDSPTRERPDDAGTVLSAKFYTDAHVHNHTLSGQTGDNPRASGITLGHNHPIFMELDYTSVIIAQKDPIITTTVATPSTSGAFPVF